MTTTMSAPGVTGGSVVTTMLGRYRDVLQQHAERLAAAPDVLARLSAAMRAAARGAAEVSQELEGARPGEGWTGESAEAYTAAARRKADRLAEAAMLADRHAAELDRLASVVNGATDMMSQIGQRFDQGANILAAMDRPGGDTAALLGPAMNLGTSATDAAASAGDSVDRALQAFIDAVSSTTPAIDGAGPATPADGTGTPADGAAKPGEPGATDPGATAPGATDPGATDGAAATPGAPGTVSGMPYADLFNKEAAEHNVPASLLAAVAKTESNFNPDATSPVGAQGLMQFMPATAAEMGIDPRDPAQAVDGAARLLRQHLDKYDGSIELAAAAYNAGPGAVDRYGGVPPYPETQAYVVKVREAMAGYGGQP